MGIRKLVTMGGGKSAGVTLPKADLQEAGFVENGEIVEGYARIERVNDGEFRVELVES
jgi:antitoxin component of MazEF toxin-antitoxin module